MSPLPANLTVEGFVTGPNVLKLRRHDSALRSFISPLANHWILYLFSPQID